MTVIIAQLPQPEQPYIKQLPEVPKAHSGIMNIRQDLGHTPTLTRRLYKNSAMHFSENISKPITVIGNHYA